jgi:lysozyme family protein
MSQNFERAFAFTHAAEGGFVLSTLEGEKSETYAGIYRLMQPTWNGWILIDGGDLGSDELKRRVKLFFFSEFWVKMNLEQLPMPIAALVFDWGVNSGRSIAIKKLQHLLLSKEDGVIGANTVALARSVDGPTLNMRYISARLDWLNDLPGWTINGRGWSQRIADILKFAAQ